VRTGAGLRSLRRECLDFPFRALVLVIHPTDFGHIMA